MQLYLSCTVCAVQIRRPADRRHLAGPSDEPSVYNLRPSAALHVTESHLPDPVPTPIKVTFLRTAGQWFSA